MEAAHTGSKTRTKITNYQKNKKNKTLRLVCRRR